MRDRALVVSADPKIPTPYFQARDPIVRDLAAVATASAGPFDAKDRSSVSLSSESPLAAAVAPIDAPSTEKATLDENLSDGLKDLTAVLSIAKEVLNESLSAEVEVQIVDRSNVKALSVASLSAKAEAPIAGRSIAKERSVVNRLAVAPNEVLGKDLDPPVPAGPGAQGGLAVTGRLALPFVAAPDEAPLALDLLVKTAPHDETPPHASQRDRCTPGGSSGPACRKPRESEIKSPHLSEALDKSGYFSHGFNATGAF